MALCRLAPLVGLVGCTGLPTLCLDSEETAAYAPGTPPREIKVLTINVWSGLTYSGIFSIGRHPDDPEQRYQILVDQVRELDPDIMAVQEANPLPYFAERLAADLDYRVIYRVALGGIRFGPVGIPTNLREGGAILVKKPWTLVDLDRQVLEGGGIATNWFCFHLGEITQAILGRAVVNGKPLYVYAVHLHSAPFRGTALDDALKEMPEEAAQEARTCLEGHRARREREVAALKEFIEATLPPGVPAVVLGDFNTSPRSGELDPLLTGGAWIDSFRHADPDAEGATWDPGNNPNINLSPPSDDPYDRLCARFDRRCHRIDVILVNDVMSKDRIVESRVVLMPKDGACASDHFGVMTTLKL